MANNSQSVTVTPLHRISFERFLSAIRMVLG